MMILKSSEEIVISKEKNPNFSEQKHNLKSTTIKTTFDKKKGITFDNFPDNFILNTLSSQPLC